MRNPSSEDTQMPAAQEAEVVPADLADLASRNAMFVGVCGAYYCPDADLVRGGKLRLSKGGVDQIGHVRIQIDHLAKLVKDLLFGDL